MSSTRGFTLLETVVGVGLVVLVLGLATLLFVRTLKASLRGTLRAEMQQQALVASNQLAQDLARTTPEGVSLRTESPPWVVAICPLSDPAQGEPAPLLANGSLLWSPRFWVYHYRESEQLLVRASWPPGAVAPLPGETSPGEPRHLDPDRLAQVVGGTLHQPKVLARGIRRLAVVHAPGGSDRLVLQPWRLEIELERPAARGPERLQYSRSYWVAEQR